MKKICATYIVLIFSFSLFISCGETVKEVGIPPSSDILLSPIDDISVIEGTRAKVFVSAIDDHLENLKFSCLNCPPYVSLNETDNGKTSLVIDAEKGTKKETAIRIQVKNGSQISIAEFKINIVEHTGPIYFCSPKKGTNVGEGTEDSPFSGLQNLLESGFVPEKNALILLMDGYHGAPLISHNHITIAAAAGHEPLLSSVNLKNANHIVLSGLNIGFFHGGEYFPKKYIVETDSMSSNICIQFCEVKSIDNSANWKESDWKEKAGSGIMFRAENSVIIGNLIQNIFHGIQTENPNILVEHNTVDRFSGDAIRNTGSNNSFVSNIMKNAVLDDYYDPDGNHDDLFQAWTFDKPIENVLLKNNIAISCLEPDLPLKSKVVQGLVCFDGFEKNWTVENNLVVTDHPHGIALYGADNCKIIHNTVLKNPRRLFHFESEPWIMVNDHKDGRESINCEVSDNYTAALNIVAKDVLHKNNTIVDSIHTDLLMDYQGWDFRIKENN